MSDEQQAGGETAEKPTGRRTGAGAGRRLADFSPTSNVPPVVPLVDADEYLAETANGGEDQGAVEDQAPAAYGRWSSGEGAPPPVYERSAPIERRYQAPPPAVPAGRQLPWEEQPGPYYGRPRPFPAPVDVLDRRRVTRRPLHLSVPEDLALAKRLEAFVFHCGVDVPGDVLAVALDEYLTQRGY